MAPPKGNLPNVVKKSAALSQLTNPAKGVATRQIACVGAQGSDAAQIDKMRKACQKAGAEFYIVAPDLTPLSDDSIPDFIFESGRSILFDAVFVPGGAKAVESLRKSPHFATFIAEAFFHGKAIAAQGEGEAAVEKLLPEGCVQDGVIFGSKASNDITEAFLEAVSVDRHWSREDAS